MQTEIIQKAMNKDDIPQRDFLVNGVGILRESKYKEIMSSIVGISKKTKWITDYNSYPTRRFEYPWAFNATYLDKGMTVLDAGCSLDPFAPFLATNGMVVTGIDNFSSHDVPWTPEAGIFNGNLHGIEKITEFSKYLRKKFRIDIDYYSEDMCATHFADCLFDPIFCISVIEHLPCFKWSCVLREWLRILKDNGRVVVTLDYINAHSGRYFNIGKMLSNSGFEVEGEINIFFQENHYIGVAAFVLKKSKNNKEKRKNFDRIYRNSKMFRWFLDTSWHKLHYYWSKVKSRRNYKQRRGCNEN